MRRDPVVDFFAVEHAHRKIDERLRNWAFWAHSPMYGRVQPMFRYYRSDEHWEGQEPKFKVDAIDAQRIQKGVGALPEPHRKAIGWAYITKSNPRAAIKRMNLGVSVQGLALYIKDARQMLINRGV
jgi:hypothetical protein